jgi:L-rhamnose mutarotase
VARRFGLTARLRDGGDAVDAYERFHARIWPEVLEDGRRSGVSRTSIFREGDRLFMVMDTDDDFRIEAFGFPSAEPRVREWQATMDTLLLDQPDLAPGHKWRPIGTVSDVE